MSRNTGGRPKKLNGQKCKRIEIRLSDQELLILQGLEKETKISRSRLFVNRILNQQDFFVTADLIHVLASLGGEVGRIGNNINQLAKHCNTVVKHHQLPSGVVNEFNELMTIHLKNEQEMYKIFRQIYRVMKKDVKP